MQSAEELAATALREIEQYARGVEAQRGKVSRLEGDLQMGQQKVAELLQQERLIRAEQFVSLEVIRKLRRAIGLYETTVRATQTTLEKERKELQALIETHEALVSAYRSAEAVLKQTAKVYHGNFGRAAETPRE